VRTLRVFEHDRILLGGAGLRQAEFDALVRFNDDHGGWYFDVGHKHLRTRQYVGYLEAGDVAIEILPKADRDATADKQPWREGLLEMLKVASGLALERLPSASQSLSRHPLIEILGRAYPAEPELLLREGLAKGHRSVEANGPVFRGRLKVIEHIRANAARADRFYVAYQTFDHHTPINRVLLAALDALSWCALSPGTAGAVEATIGQFPDLAIAGVDAAAIDRIRLTRATHRYAAALTYARMILAHQGPQLRAGRARVFALLFDMNTLWERYIAALVRRAAPAGTEVHTQEQHAFWEPQPRGVRRVRPDIVLRSAAGQALLVLDTKWKVPKNGAPSDDDLKQMFVYNELLHAERAVLLYPQTRASVETSGRYAGKAHGCEQRQVGVLDGVHWSTPAIVQQLTRLLARAEPGSDDHALSRFADTISADQQVHS